MFLILLCFFQGIAGQAVRLAFDFAQAPRSLTARNDNLTSCVLCLITCV